MRTLKPLVVALVLAAGCAKGSGTVVLDVSAVPPLAGVATLSGTVAVGSRTVPINVTLTDGPVAIDSGHIRTLAIVVPLSLGDQLTATLDASDSNGITLGTGMGTKMVLAGKRVDLSITLGPLTLLDMGVPDLDVEDAGSMCNADLGDAGGICPPPPDMCVPGNCLVLNGQGCRPGTTTCQSGNCVDDYCCSVQTCPTCQGCTGPGGTCVNQLGPGNNCNGTNTCDGNGSCVAQGSLGAACAHATDCTSGNCVDGHCCGTASCGLCLQCTGAGGTCVAKAPGVVCSDGVSVLDTACDGSGHCKHGLGKSCTTATDCYNSICTDGTCCASSCTSQCQACNNATGTCTPVTGKPLLGTPAGRQDCLGTGTPCYGACNGSNISTCTYPPFGTACGTQCVPSNPAYLQAMTCDGSGRCDETTGPQNQCGTGAVPGSIATTQCTGANCKANCASDTDCSSSTYCSTAKAPNGIAGTCLPGNPSGTNCATTDCESAGCRFCSSSSPCQGSGQCCSQTCNAPTCTNTTTLTTSTCSSAGVCSPFTTTCLCVNTPPAQCKVCAADSDCTTSGAYYCSSAHVCQARIASGSPCTVDCAVANCAQCQGGSVCPPGTGQMCP